MNFLKNLFVRSQITNEHQEMMRKALKKLDKLDDIDKNVTKIKATQVEQGKAIGSIDKRLSNIEKLLEANFNKVFTQTEMLANRLKTITANIQKFDRPAELIPLINRLLNDIKSQINLMPPSQLDINSASDEQKAYIYIMSKIEKAIEDSRVKLDKSIALSGENIVKGVNTKSFDYANQLAENMNGIQRTLYNAIYKASSRNSSNIQLEDIKQIVRNETRPAGSSNSYL
jgi:phage-related protein